MTGGICVGTEETCMRRNVHENDVYDGLEIEAGV